MSFFTPARPVYARDPDLSLGRAARIFFHQLPPMIVGFGFLAFLTTRVWWGPFSWLDLLPALVLFCAHPFAEWLIHVFILHHRPRRVFGVRFDMIGARHHRAHHRDPWDLRFVVMPVPTALSIGTAIAVAAWLVCPSFSLFLTTMTLTAGTAFYYEWVHFLSHTSYRPRGAWFKRQWRLHRLHHFKNEGYWFGVTRHFGDTVFGTFPEAEAVPTSKTARTLGVAD